MCVADPRCVAIAGLSVGFGPQTEGPETPNPSFFNMRERPEAREIWENRNYAITQVKPEMTGLLCVLEVHSHRFSGAVVLKMHICSINEH